MNPKPDSDANVKQVVPFLCVSGMEQSLHFYREGLRFQLENQWVVDGRIRWCWLTKGGASVMLQEFPTEGRDSWKPSGKVGEGVSLYFMCQDALAIYDDVLTRGIKASEPQVGNGMWVTTLSDPDGYVIHFESLTDAPEETRLSEARG